MDSTEEIRLNALLKLHEMAHASVQDLTDHALESAVQLTGSRIGYLAFLSDDERVLTMHSWSRTAMSQCAIQDKPIVYPVVDTGLWGEAVRQRRPVLTNDYPAPNPLKKGYPAGHVAVQRHMNAPVFDGDRIVIVAGVGNKDTPYHEGDVRQLTLLMQGLWQILVRRKAEEALALQAREILELSTPVLEVWDGVLVAPLIGVLDSGRARQLTERVLERIGSTGARHVLLDITGVSVMDTATARYLVEAIQAMALMGTEAILTGIRPAVAQTLVHVGVDLSRVRTCATLKTGLRMAMK